MASCITPQWGNNYSPQVRLTVSEKSSNDTQVVLNWTLEYVAHGYAVSTSNTKSYTAVIAGQTVASGSYAINGKTGTSTIASGTKTINKTTSSQNITFSCSMTFNVTWNGVYGGEKSASSSITVGAKTSYTVAYNANGGSGAPSSQTKWYGTNITLSDTKPSRTGYTFQGWGTSSGDTTVDYAAGATYSANASITLYAIWKAVTYTVSYDANGGSGAPSNQTKTYDVNLTLSSTKPTRTNYNFKGWGTSSSATTVSYNAGGTYTQNASITLYAIWELAYTKPRISNPQAIRCNSDGTETDSGEYLKVKFNWATDRNVTDIKVQYLNGSTWTNDTTISASGTSGTVNQVTSNGWNAEKTYQIRFYVSDSGGTTYSSELTIGTIKYPIDVKSGGTGVAFGKVAELDNILDVNYDVKFRKNMVIDGNRYVADAYGGTGGTSGYVGIIQITITAQYCSTPLTFEITQRSKGMPTRLYVRFNGEVPENCTIGTFWYSGMPINAYIAKISSGIFRIYVEKYGTWDQVCINDYFKSNYDDGKCKIEWIQEFITNLSTLPNSYEKAVCGTVNNNLTTTSEGFALDARQGKVLNDKLTLATTNKVLWSGVYYMTAGHTANLSEKISAQPHGIVLIWNFYNGSVTTQGWQRMFIPKYVITIGEGYAWDMWMGATNFQYACGKALYIYDDHLIGADINAGTGTGVTSGINYSNDKYVLRYVIGV